jgi:hypothetical protein
VSRFAYDGAGGRDLAFFLNLKQTGVERRIFQFEQTGVERRIFQSETNGGRET